MYIRVLMYVFLYVNVNMDLKVYISGYMHMHMYMYVSYSSFLVCLKHLNNISKFLYFLKRFLTPKQSFIISRTNLNVNKTTKTKFVMFQVKKQIKCLSGHPICQKLSF